MNFIEKLAQLAQQQRNAINSIQELGFVILDIQSKSPYEEEQISHMLFKSLKGLMPSPQKPIKPNMERIYLYRNVIISAEMLTELLNTGTWHLEPVFGEDVRLLSQVTDAIQALLRKQCYFDQSSRTFNLVSKEVKVKETDNDLPNEEGDLRGIIGLLQKVFGGEVISMDDLKSDKSVPAEVKQPQQKPITRTEVKDIADLPTMSMDSEGFLNINLANIKGIKVIGEGKPLTINFENCHLGIVGDGEVVIKSNTENGNCIHLNPQDLETKRPLTVEETVQMHSPKNGMEAITNMKETKGEIIDLANKIDQPDAIRFLCKYILCDIRKEITLEQARNMDLVDLLSNPSMSKFFDMETLKLTKQGKDLFNVLNRTHHMKI